MDCAQSDISRRLANIINAKRISWLETFYYDITCIILDYNNFSSTYYRAKPGYVDTLFQFEIKRLSELQFRINFQRTAAFNSKLVGNYVIQFHCETNVFDDDPKIVEMQSNEFRAFADFLINASCHQELPSSAFKKQLDLKISVQLIEFDYFYPSNICDLLNGLLKSNEFFNNEFVINDMHYILCIPRLEDAFVGRQNEAYTFTKWKFICRTAFFSRKIASYLRSRNTSTTAQDLELLLKNLLNDTEERVHDTHVLQLYIDANYLGFDFLILLSRDCLLYRLSEYETGNTSDYECLLLFLLQAAVRVNDKYLFEKCTENIDNSQNHDFFLGNFLRKLEMTIYSRFVLRSLEIRNKEIESQIGAGAERSRILEFYSSVAY